MELLIIFLFATGATLLVLSLWLLIRLMNFLQAGTEAFEQYTSASHRPLPHPPTAPSARSTEPPLPHTRRDPRGYGPGTGV